MAFIGLAMSMSTYAVRAVHQLFPQKHSDGTTVMLYTNGDGRLAFYTTADDQVVVRNSKGDLCYAALKDGKLVPTNILAHNIGERTAEEKAFVLANPLKPTDEALQELFVPRNMFPGTQSRIMKALATSSSDGIGTYGVSALGPVPSIGKLTIPVIMVEFSDRKFQESCTIDKYSRFLNKEGYNEDDESQRGSVRDYFLSQSRGMFDPTFNVVAKVTLNNPYKVYGADSGSNVDADVFEMVKDAVAAAVEQNVDFSQFAIDGKVPNVMLVYAGYGQATGGDENTVWPHARELTGSYSKIGDYEFGSYFVGNELYDGRGTTPMGMGVMVHELGHVLGLPDFYETKHKYQSSDAPMGSWSVMDGGPYYPSGVAYTPVGYSAYERSYMGWLKLRELDESEAVTLSTVSDTENEYAVLLRNPNLPSEYFILENRSADTWFPASLGTGLLVTRICYSSSVWSRNAVNDFQDYKRAMVVTASGRKMTGSGQPGDLFGNGVNNIPQFKLFNNTMLNAPVYNIMKNPDGVLTFSFRDKTKVSDYTVSNDVVYEKLNDASTLAEGDEIVLVDESHSVALATGYGSGKLLAVRVKVADGKMYGNDMVNALKLRPSGPNWLLMDGNKYLTSSTSGLKYSVSMSASSFATISITDGAASVKFGGTSKKSYLGFSDDDTAFITFASAPSSLQIYRLSNATGINTVETGSASGTDGRLYNLSGQQVDDNYKGIVVKNGKKYLKK